MSSESVRHRVPSRARIFLRKFTDSVSVNDGPRDLACRTDMPHACPIGGLEGRALTTAAMPLPVVLFHAPGQEHPFRAFS